MEPDLGVVTGKGFYHNWGPNYTADPIIIRTDTEEPMVLLIRRNDTGRLALAGGFIEKGESSLDAAFREAHEETLVNWTQFNPVVRQVYSGPLADVRVTANAWPETTAYAMLLDPTLSAQLTTEPSLGNSEEVQGVVWLPISEVDSSLFGSHRLLVEMAKELI